MKSTIQHLLLIVFAFTIALISFSCGNGNPLDNAARFRPTATGGLDEILIVADPSFKEDSLGKWLKNHLERDFPKVPQSERSFAISIVDYAQMNDLLKNFRNMIFIGHLEQKNAAVDFMKTSLDKRVSQGKFPVNGMIPELWSKGQKVFFHLAENEEQLLSSLPLEIDRITNKIANNELNKYKDMALVNGSQVKLKQLLAENHGYSMEVPADYRLVLEEPNLLWLRKDEGKAIMNVVIGIYSLDSAGFENSAENIRHWFGRKYIDSQFPNDYMRSDTMTGVASKEVIFNGKPAFENRGLWAMEKAFMGGPFLNYYIHDEENKRAVFLEGFVFAPSQSKKSKMRTLESLLKTFEFKAGQS